MPGKAVKVAELLSMSHRLIDVSDSPRLDCQILLGRIINRPRTWLIANDDHEVDACTADAFYRQLDRRATGEPLAYITGVREFRSLEFKVTPDTLIPRPETELLVELALAKAPANRARVADLGTGCGAIALALAKARPAWHIVGSDISRATLDVARANRERHRCDNVELVQADWCHGLEGSFDLIVSNPPYVRDRDPHLAALVHEPLTALVAGEDGLEDIQQIIQGAATLLTRSGSLILEHGYDQKDAVCELLAEAGYRNVTAHKDMAGHDRAVIATRPERER